MIPQRLERASRTSRAPRVGVDLVSHRLIALRLPAPLASRATRLVCSLALLTASFGVARIATAAPPDPGEYVVLTGGLFDIQPGTILEGSLVAGGRQPDYIIDVENETFKEFLAAATDAAAAETTKVGKIDAVIKTINAYLRNTSYTSRPYLNLLRRHRAAGTDVPVSDYLACGAGVCREHALLLHFGLKSVGIENLHAYAKVVQGAHVEDHAFVIVNYGNRDYVVDAYNGNFNGLPLDALMAGVKDSGRVERPLPFHEPDRIFRRILAFNPYPRLYAPKRYKRHLETTVRTLSGCEVLQHRVTR